MKSSGIKTPNYRMRTNLNRITNFTVSTATAIFYSGCYARLKLILMKRPNRNDDKYWNGTQNFNHLQYESDLEDYVTDLQNDGNIISYSKKDFHVGQDVDTPLGKGVVVNIGIFRDVEYFNIAIGNITVWYGGEKAKRDGISNYEWRWKANEITPLD